LQGLQLKISGTMVALVTPMDTHGAIDHDAFARLLEHQVAGGVDGVVVGGTTGESPTLATEELAALVALARERLPDDITVVAGSGTNSTERSVVLTRRMFDAGADACMAVTPYYNKPSQRGLRRHYEAVADAASGPVILYNVPSRTGCDMLPETVAALVAHPRIDAVKEAVPEMARIRDLRRMCGEDFVVLSGDDPTLVDALEEGVNGVISVTGNVAPKPVSDIVAAGRAGDIATARRIDSSLRDLHSALFVESNPIPVKWALSRLGVINTPGLRLPMTPLDPVHEPVVESALRAARLL
jgi:4-hydroxy-tetrahydrodipicolinate synthase